MATAFTGPVRDNAFRVLSLVLLAAPTLLFIWLNSIQVTINREGVSYHSLFGEREIQWTSVERFYYGATRQSVHFIPIGTYYYFKFVDHDGNKLRLGNRVGSPKKLGASLARLSYPALFKQAYNRYNTGQEVDFGAIRVQSDTGIMVRTFFDKREIPWNQVSNFAIQEGRFYIWQKGKKRARGPSLRNVPNAFALEGLLRSVLRPGNSL